MKLPNTAKDVFIDKGVLHYIAGKQEKSVKLPKWLADFIDAEWNRGYRDGRKTLASDIKSLLQI